MKKHATTVIIGGGISGLATAWWLHRAGIDVVVLEREREVGGTMKTVRENGWLVETGPNSALETSPLFQTLVDDLSLQEQFVYADDRSSKRYILRNGALHQLPMSPPLLIRSNLWTWPGKLRLLKEPFVGRASREETIAEFVERRLGREFLDYAINPFVAGVYAGNPEELSVRAAFPKLYALEEKYGGLVKGMIRGARERKKRAEKSKQSARMFSFRDGMQALPCALHRALNNRITPGTDVVSIVKKDRRFIVSGIQGTTGFSLTADVVITAVPSFRTADMIHPFDEALADELRTVQYPPVAEVFFGCRREDVAHPLDGFGFLVPAKEKRNILGTIWSSSLFPQRAPEGHVALTTFVGGSRQPELASLPDDRLSAMVKEELRAIVGMTGDPVFVSINRWQRAIPQYRIGHLSLIERVERLEREQPGLFVAGNFRGGISVGDCVASSERTAHAVQSHLKGQ